jgi:hypothetical protein
MAGSFGYEQGHEVSQACGERVLFPAVREKTSLLPNSNAIPHCRPLAFAA